MYYELLCCYVVRSEGCALLLRILVTFKDFP